MPTKQGHGEGEDEDMGRIRVMQALYVTPKSLSLIPAMPHVLPTAPRSDIPSSSAGLAADIASAVSGRSRHLLLPELRQGRSPRRPACGTVMQPHWQRGLEACGQAAGRRPSAEVTVEPVQGGGPRHGQQQPTQEEGEELEK